jgi:hypothetical protein
MTPKTTYELTITEKLQHLPLPDLEDAIWARVKNQLDHDLPTDDGGDSGPDLPPAAVAGCGVPGSLALLLFLLPIFYFLKTTIVFYNRNKQFKRKTRRLPYPPTLINELIRCQTRFILNEILTHYRPREIHLQQLLKMACLFQTLTARYQFPQRAF